MASEEKNQNKAVISIAVGPNELQLIMSLTRPKKAPYGVDMERGTSVHFTTKGPHPDIAGFDARISSMVRDEHTDDPAYILEGGVFDYENIKRFRGWYNTKTRQGNFTFYVD